MARISLHDDAVASVFAYLSQEDLMAVSKVNTQWKRVASYPTWWTSVSFTSSVALMAYVAASHGAHIKSLDLRPTELEDIESNNNVVPSVPTRVLMMLATNCTSLESLDVSLLANSMTDEILSLFIRNNQDTLQILKANQCGRITDQSFLNSSLKSLRHLGLGHSRQITSNCLSSVTKHARRLECLEVTSCPKINDAAVVSVASSCPKLTVLKMAGAGLVRDSGVVALANSTSELTHLDISCSNPFGGNRHVKDAAMTLLLQRCLRLKTLKLKGCVSLTPAVWRLMDDSNTLESLDVSGCRKMFLDDSVAASQNFIRMTRLKEVGLMACVKVNDSLVKTLAASAPGLKKLDIQGCGVSESTINVLKEQSSCDVLHLNTLQVKV